MAKLDNLVITHLADRLFEPSRLEAILASVAARRARDVAQVDERLSALRSQLTHVEEKLRRIYKMVEDGVAEIDDILKSRINELKDERDRTGTALERIDHSIAGRQDITAEAIGRFATAMRHNIVMAIFPSAKPTSSQWSIALRSTII